MYTAWLRSKSSQQSRRYAFVLIWKNRDSLVTSGVLDMYWKNKNVLISYARHPGNACLALSMADMYPS